MKGYFRLEQERPLRINFKGIAFGGVYGGHNVNIEISQAAKKKLASSGLDSDGIEELLVEVQRRIMGDDMIVEFDKIKPEQTDALGNISA